MRVFLISSQKSHHRCNQTKNAPNDKNDKVNFNQGSIANFRLEILRRSGTHSLQMADIIQQDKIKNFLFVFKNTHGSKILLDAPKERIVQIEHNTDKDFENDAMGHDYHIVTRRINQNPPHEFA